MDTFFFILRKNNHQITVLHVYHHATMLNIWWFVMNWVPCGHCKYGVTVGNTCNKALFWFSFGQTKHLRYLQLLVLFCPILSCFAELQLLQIVAGTKLPAEPLEKARLRSLKNFCGSVTFVSCRSPGLIPVNLAFSFLQWLRTL